MLVLIEHFSVEYFVLREGEGRDWGERAGMGCISGMLSETDQDSMVEMGSRWG